MKGLWRTSAFRQAALYSLAFTVAMALALTALYFSTIGLVERQTRATIDAEVQGLSEQFAAGGLSRLAATIRQRSRAEPGTNSVYLLVTPGYASLAGNLTSWPKSAPENGAFEMPIIRTTGTGEVSRSAFAQSFTLSGGYRLLVGRDAEELAQTRRLFVTAGLWIGAATIIFGLVTGLYLSRRVLARVAAAAEAGEKIAAGRFDSRLPIGPSGDEFDRLAGSVNALMDRIERLMQGMRIATDSISHDLRRPLTRLRARLELAAASDPDVMGEAMEEVDAATAILENLLKIAQAEAGNSAQFADISLDQVVGDAVELYQPVAEDREMSLALLSSAVCIRGERQLLAQAIANLLDNALKHAPGSGATINVSVGADGGRARVVVADTGPGIAPDARMRVTERFVRLDESRQTEGAGLGLSLVKAVAELHRGSLLLEDNSPGLRAVLEFPVSGAADPIR
ncbi:sensor histidine kinase [Algicella marina]|uniref:histidine kinase n=1 Tax=Algicella marina TaxID=2683284 RepID=A0A6P1T1E1_9RHOB|nr:HAMP domain-containing sensor histidine kinase [Algicella marina]QHQ36558.1 HAMP domain-containing protein [Algicella marina]